MSFVSDTIHQISNLSLQILRFCFLFFRGVALSVCLFVYFFVFVLHLTFSCCCKGSYLKLIDEQGVVVGMETGAVSCQLFHWNGLPWWWALRNDRYCNNITTSHKIYVDRTQDHWLRISKTLQRKNDSWLAYTLWAKKLHGCLQFIFEWPCYFQVILE